MLNTLFLTLLLAACGSLDTGPRAGADREDGQERQAGAIARSASQLQLLPQNTRYFQYNGLPMVLFGNQAGLAPTPTATFDPDHLEKVSRHGNSLFTAAHPTWVDASYEELLATLNDDAHWANLADIARVAYEQDVILHVYFWSYKWNFQGQGWTGSDMIWSDPAQDGGEVVDGLTRKDLHELLMDRVLEATWQYPNVVYNMMWEYNTRVDEGSGPQAQFDDRNGDFHRWWIGELRERGSSLDPAVHHLIATTDGRAAPGDASATFGTATTPDFIVEEDGNGFWYSHETGRETLLDYHVPLVFMSSDYPFGDNAFSGWENVAHGDRTWDTKEQGPEYRVSAADVREMLLGGFHPAHAWAPAQDEALDYYLQARWYMENRGVLDADMSGALRELPDYTPGERPSLSNPDGYGENGRRGSLYGVVYEHPEGLAPAQAQVWIDVNGDGVFSPDPADGERFDMQAVGGDYRTGMVYVVDAVPDRPYVFRFADANWNPPVTGGLVPGETSGISYSYWQ